MKKKIVLTANGLNSLMRERENLVYIIKKYESRLNRLQKNLELIDKKLGIKVKK